jgi:AcrR family transcriptional regulator
MKNPLRSQATRDRIVDAARRIFGEEGYERTTIRAVAAAADIHPSMVMRYYQSKEGLFSSSMNFDLHIPDLSAVPRKEVGRTLVRHALERWSSSEGELPALLRISVTHEDARNRLADLLCQQIVPAIAPICGSRRAATSAGLVASQMLGLALTRFVLRLPIVTGLSDRLIIQEMGPQIQAYIDGRRPS